jgi:hypothetical protein
VRPELALRPLAVGGTFATLCDRPAGLSSATRQPRSNGRTLGGEQRRGCMLPRTTPTPPRHLLGQLDPEPSSARAGRSPESRKRCPGSHYGRSPAEPVAHTPVEPDTVVDPAVDGVRWRHCQVRPPAPRSTPETSSWRRRVRRIQPDTSTMRATDNHRADRRAGHVSCGPFDQRRRDGAADPARRHGLAVRNPGLRSIRRPCRWRRAGGSHDQQLRPDVVHMPVDGDQGGVSVVADSSTTTRSPAQPQCIQERVVHSHHPTKRSSCGLAQPLDGRSRPGLV